MATVKEDFGWAATHNRQVLLARYHQPPVFLAALYGALWLRNTFVVNSMEVGRRFTLAHPEACGHLRILEVVMV
jgi:hypothetical protein